MTTYENWNMQRLSFMTVQAIAHGASWDDVMAKAKRLILNGDVDVIHNTPTLVTGVVQGDHGTYKSAISRHDPDSQAIEQWVCECWLPGQQVVMADGSVKPIERVEVGDLVMTATGHPGIVGRQLVREYDGQIVGLKMTGSTQTVWMTAGHKLPDADFNVVEAKDWRAGDFSYLPMPCYEEQTEIDVTAILPNLIESEGWLYRRNQLFGSKRVHTQRRPVSVLDPRQHPVPARIVLDRDFARLAGLYLAEGMVTPRGEFRFSFGPREEHLIEETVELLDRVFGLQAFTKFAKHAWQVSFNSQSLANVFRHLFGTGAREKRIHGDIMAMPLSSLAVFLEAWVEGDGHITKDGRTSLHTVSEHLAMQARLILARLGRESVIRGQESNASPLVPGGGRIFHVIWRTDGGPGRGVRFFEGDQVHQQMEAPEYKDYVGPVYNIEVISTTAGDIGSHTYVMAPGITSFNCPWHQYAFLRTRQWKKLEGRVCSHVMALYMQARMTPLDTSGMDEGYQPGRGQRIGPAGPGQMSFDDQIADQQLRDQGLTRDQVLQMQQQDQIEQPMPYMGEQPSEPPSNVPVKQDAIPVGPQVPPGQQPVVPYVNPGQGQMPATNPLYQQMNLWDATIPNAGAPGLAPLNPVSIPGGRPSTPLNPLDQLGTGGINTLSHLAGITYSDADDFAWHYAKNDFEDWATSLLARGYTPRVMFTTPGIHLEARGGKIPVPGAVPIGWTTEGLPQYRTLDLGWNPLLQRRMNANEGGPHGEGAPELRGQFHEVKPGGHAELRYIEPALKSAYVAVHLPGSGPLHPKSLEGWVDYEDLTPHPNQRSPLDPQRR